MKAIIEMNKNACHRITLEHRPNTYTHNGSGDWYVECFCDEDGGVIRKATNDIVQAAKFYESLVCKYGGYRRYKKQRYNIVDLIEAEEKRGLTVRLD